MLNLFVVLKTKIMPNFQSKLNYKKNGFVKCLQYSVSYVIGILNSYFVVLCLFCKYSKLCTTNVVDDDNCDLLI